MNSLYSVLLAAMAIAAAAPTHAQSFTTCPASPSECVVEWEGTDGLPIINALRNTVANDTDRPADRVYVLRRGGLYYNEDRIANDGFDLLLIGRTAEEGATAGDNVCGTGGDEDCGPAVLQRFRREDNSSDDRMIESAGDGNGGHTLENIWVMGQDNTGIRSSYEPITVNSSNSRFVYDNVVFDTNIWHHLGFKGAGNTIVVRNSSFRNIAAGDQRYQGRGMRLEAGADSVIVENSTFFNLTSFPFQSEAAPADYFLFNHNTLVNFGLTFSAGNIWKEAYVTNNVMVNPFWQGEDAGLYNGPNRIDPFAGVFQIDALPSRFGLEIDRRIVLANNTYGRSAELTNHYATFDPVVRPQPLVNDTTATFIATYDGMVQQGNLDVIPSFANAPLTTDIYNEMKAFISQIVAGTAGAYPLVAWDPDRDSNPLAINWPLPEDLSYSDASLLTAGTDDLPLGDLNWFPDAKADYLANRADYLADLSDLAGGAPEVPIAQQSYPGEDGTLTDATVGAVSGFTSLYFEGGGSLEWTFSVPADGTYGLDLLTDLRGSNPRGQRVIVDGGNLRNRAENGEMMFCTADFTDGSGCPQPIDTANGFTTHALRNTHLIDDTVDRLVLTAGEHTLRIEPSWGYQAFSTITVVDAADATVVELAPADATTEGVAEECEDPDAFCAQGFEYADLGASGSVSWTVDVPAGGASLLPRFFYQSASGGTAELIVDGTKQGDVSFAPAGGSGATELVSSRFNAAEGARTVTLKATSGDVLLDYAIFNVYESGVVANEDELPDGWALGQSFPNPAVDAATIRFALAEPADVTLTVYDVLGREVARLADGMMGAGPHAARLDTHALASGTYLYRLTTPVGAQTRRLTVVR